MGELGELRNRVDQAVDRLAVANDARRRQSQGLMTLMSDLEAKYEARDEELEHCRRRIEVLTRANDDLSGLVEKLVQIVDTTVTSQDEDALFRAAAMAADLVTDWSGPGDDAETVEPAEGAAGSGGETDRRHDEPETAAVDDADHDIVSSADDDGAVDDEIATAPGPDTASEAFAGPSSASRPRPALRFEDVNEEELAGERLDGDPEALAVLLDTPLTPDIGHDERMAQEVAEPIAVMEIDGDDAAAVAEPAERDTGDIGLTDIDTASIDQRDEIDPILELLSADLDIPEISLEDAEPISRIDPDEDTESSIRAMMARLEQAASRAKARAEDAPETAAEIDEAPAVAAAGGS